MPKKCSVTRTGAHILDILGLLASTHPKVDLQFCLCRWCFLRSVSKERESAVATTPRRFGEKPSTLEQNLMKLVALEPVLDRSAPGKPIFLVGSLSTTNKTLYRISAESINMRLLGLARFTSPLHFSTRTLLAMAFVSRSGLVTSTFIQYSSPHVVCAAIISPNIFPTKTESAKYESCPNLGRLGRNAKSATGARLAAARVC